MLEVKKEPRAKEIEIMRALIRDRGSYLYCLVEAAKRRGWTGSPSPGRG